jgi:biopolymer transport protein TolR
MGKKHKHKRHKPVSEINVVPYIDVMLVLLVIFMVTAPLLMQGVKVELPEAPAKPINTKDVDPVIVSIKADRSLYINLGKNQEEAVPIDRIKDQVGKIMRYKPETPVLVWGDWKVDYGSVVSLMTELQAVGVPDVGLVTENPRS